MKLTSTAFDDGGTMPVECTADGSNMSPALAWRNLPEGTKQLALIVDDPDAPRAEPFVHWVAYAISPELEGLPPGVPKHAQVNDLRGLAQGMNDFDQIGYDGPAPPRGSGPHRYRFELFALDRELQTAPKGDHKVLRAAMQGKILDRAMLVGMYERTTATAGVR